MMNIREIVDHINTIEDTLPVQEWKYKGVDVWPIIRTKLYFDLFNYSAFHTFDETIKPKKIIRVFNFVREKVLSELQAVKHFILNPRTAHYRFKKTDALFLADPSYIKLGNTNYQRFCDPVVEDLISLGKEVTVLTALQDRSVQTKTPSYFVSTALLRLYTLEYIKSVLTKKQKKEINLPGLDAYNAYISKLGNGAKLVTPQNFIADMSIFFSIVKYYKSILHKTLPRCAFIVSYYDDYNMAFVYACHQKGIPVIDLQHGAVNDFNGGYGRWNKIPKSGYNTLPDYFACWDQEAVNCIRAWSDQTSTHKPFLFGNRFLEMFLHGNAPYSDGFNQVFANVQEQFKPSKNILLSLQTKYVLPDFFKEMMQKAPKSYFWWIRLHPMMTPVEIASIQKGLSELKGVNFDVDQSTNNLLYSILPHMDTHVTLNSSVVQEAIHFGVLSIICEETGYEYYMQEMEKGYAFAAYTPDEALELVEQSDKEKSVNQNTIPETLYRELGLIETNAASRKSALIISLTPVTDEPRVRRQAQALMDAGWNVIVSGFEGRAQKPDGWTLITLPYHEIRLSNKYAQFFFRQIRRSILLPLITLGRLNYTLAKFAYWKNWQAKKNFDTLKETLVSRPEIKPCLIISHDYQTAPMADELAHYYSCPFSIDIHEYSREQYDHRLVWRLIFKPWVHRMQSIYLKKSAFNTTVCDGISQLLAKDYNMTEPTVIRSVPSYVQMPFRPVSDKITVMYHGIIYPTRGLELAIKSLPLWREEFHLVIRGPGSQPYIEKLQSLADSLKVSDRITFEPPVLFHEIIPAANKADIGYFVQEDFSFQKHFALPNKFFEYIAAGLALCIGDLPEMARITRKYDLGKLPYAYTPESIANTINSFTRDSINQYKQNSLEAAKELSWQKESSRMVAAYEGLL